MQQTHQNSDRHQICRYQVIRTPVLTDHDGDSCQRDRRRDKGAEVVLFDILAVISLAIGEPKQALLENGIYPIPQGNRKAQLLLIV
jgi:hypothetical protein